MKPLAKKSVVVSAVPTGRLWWSLPARAAWQIGRDKVVADSYSFSHVGEREVSDIWLSPSRFASCIGSSDYRCAHEFHNLLALLRTARTVQLCLLCTGLMGKKVENVSSVFVLKPQYMLPTFISNCVILGYVFWKNLTKVYHKLKKQKQIVRVWELEDTTSTVLFYLKKKKNSSFPLVAWMLFLITLEIST